MEEPFLNDPSLHPPYTTLDEWITCEATHFSLDSSEAFHNAVDRVITSIGDNVTLLGLGEAFHGGEDILTLRNRLFQYLVEKHGYSAIAIESSFPRGRLVNEYVAGHSPESYETVQDRGFSHGFGRIDANRELVEWMKRYNADSSHPVKLRFYGFDSPTEMTNTDSPRPLLHFVIDYLTSIDNTSGREYRQRIEPLLGKDADWENPAAMMDPTQSIGLSPAATALRIETEELISELCIRRPELVAMSDEIGYLEAVRYATQARQLLTYHAAMARESNNRIVRLLGIREAMMADNLAYIVSREDGRGRVFAFAHNSHLQYTKTVWQPGPDMYTWWAAGSHLKERFGSDYAVIGSGVGVSITSGIDQPEAGTLEACLTAIPGPVRLIPTFRGQRLPTSVITGLPVRSGSVKNSSYFALTPRSFIDFDWLVFFDSIP